MARPADVDGLGPQVPLDVVLPRPLGKLTLRGFVGLGGKMLGAQLPPRPGTRVSGTREVSEPLQTAGSPGCGFALPLHARKRRKGRTSSRKWWPQGARGGVRLCLKVSAGCAFTHIVTTAVVRRKLCDTRWTDSNISPSSILL